MKVIENPQQKKDMEICTQLDQLVKHEVNINYAKLMNEGEREQRKKDYEVKREKVLEEKNDF